MKKLLYSLLAVLAIYSCTPVAPNTDENKPGSTEENPENPNNPDNPDNPDGPDNPDTPDVPKYEAPELVDLGLPSGVKWAAWDLGSSSPEDPGDFFSWGETEAATYFGNSNKYWEYEGGNGYATKYSVSWRQGRLVDMKTVLEAEDDAATVGLGEGWRTPCKADFDELLDNCDCKQTFINDKEAYTFTSRINGKSITFLNTGHYDGSSMAPSSMYMSSSLVCEDQRACLNNAVYALYGSSLNGGGYRSKGMNVRPVYGGTAKEHEWMVRADDNPQVDVYTATIGGNYLFEQNPVREYKYFIRLFDKIEGDSWCAQKDIVRGSTVTFTDLKYGHTYYYVLCSQAKWYEGGYSLIEEHSSEVLSFTTVLLQ